VNICLVADSLEIGGAERHVVDLARGLRCRGHRVTIACSVTGPLVSHLADTDIEIEPMMRRRAKRRVSTAYAWALRRRVRLHRFDLIHAHLYASQAAAALATLGGTPPLVMTEHSEGSWQSRRERRVARWFLTRAQQVIAVSPAIRDRLTSRMGLRPDRVNVIANVAGPLTVADRGLMPEIDAEGTGMLRAGVVGRLCPEKGHATFLEAVAAAGLSPARARFVIVGDGPLRPALERRARGLGVGDQVQFLGWRTNARAIIASLDLLVVPSLTEGSPLVVAEALSAGVPVLASRVGDIPTRVSSGGNGVLVAPGDATTLAAALRRLLLDSGRLTALRARAVAESGRNGHEEIVRRVEAVYRLAIAMTQPTVSRWSGADELHDLETQVGSIE
jgi:glycosyltransferase involved in cell wall biosynthesis